VPVLVYLLHQAPRAATTGSLLIVGITAAGGMIAHWRAGRVRLAPAITFGVLGAACLTGPERTASDRCRVKTLTVRICILHVRELRAGCIGMEAISASVRVPSSRVARP
jgi:hypothetical protein